MRQTTKKPITDPVDLNQNPARRGAHYHSPLQWPAELLSPAERKRELKLLASQYIMFAVAVQLAAGTVPGLAEYRGPTFAVAFFMVLTWLQRIPLLAYAGIALSPFCLLLPWYTEFIALRTLVCVGAPLYAAYQFRQHLLTFVSAAPLPTEAATRFRQTGELPQDVPLLPPLDGTLKGFILGLESWFTYLGNEQRLPTVYESPAGFWYSRTFLTALGVFGMVFLLPHEWILVVAASLLSLLHPALVLLAFPIVVLAPVFAMVGLAFLFTVDRLRAAWSLKQYAVLSNTFSGLMDDLVSKESRRV